MVLAVGDAVVSPVGAVALLLWYLTGRGVAQRVGWVRPDPTLYRDGLAPWVLVTVAVTAVDLVLLLAVHLLVGRLARPRGGRALAAVAHLLVAAGLALAYAAGAWR